MKTKAIFFVVLAVLALFSASAGAAEPGESSELAEAGDVAVPETAREGDVSPAVQEFLENLAARQSLALDEEKSWQGAFGSCYTGCFSAQQSSFLCPSGQIAEVTVSGPTYACGLYSWRCVATCSGPVVQCAQFTDCNGN